MRTALLVSIILLVGCGYRPESPLARAVMAENVQEVRNRLASGTTNPDDVQEALVAAARIGEEIIIPDLVKHGAELEAASGVNGWTPLQHAIHKNRLGSVRALIEAGANPNGAGAAGRTPLMMAAGYGQTHIVQLLLDKGADPQARSSDNLTALDMALTGVGDIDRWTNRNCQTATIKMLLDRFPKLRPARETSLPGARCPEIDAIFKQQRATM
jgi:ankyrin repeat protein